MITIIKDGLVRNTSLNFTCKFCECRYMTHLASLDKNEQTLRSTGLNWGEPPEFILTSKCPQCQFPNQIHSPKARELKNEPQNLSTDNRSGPISSQADLPGMEEDKGAPFDS